MDKITLKAQELSARPARRLHAPIANRVAYVVSYGASFASHGYAVRTQGIAKSLNDAGLDCVCFVRPGRPWDLEGSTRLFSPEVTIDGVRYIHTRWPKNEAPAGEDVYFGAAVEKFVELFSVYRPASVMAASNWVVGLPAWVAAKQLGLPFFYEVRGFWGLSRDAREPGYIHTQAYKTDVEREMFVAKEARKVFTLNNPMRDQLVTQGLHANKIEIVPNGVLSLPNLQAVDTALKQQLGIEAGEKLIGYVGSFNPYEGLDLLIEACCELVRQGEKLKLLLVGDDQPLTLTNRSVTSVAQAAGIGLRERAEIPPWVIQVGRVPHERVGDYYALLDVVVIPRKPLAVCRLVPPMKIVEALAYGKRVVVSDVAPLAVYADKYQGVVSFEAGSVAGLVRALQTMPTLPPPPKPRLELLLSALVVPMVRALKEERIVGLQQEVVAPSSNLAQTNSGLGEFTFTETFKLPRRDPLWFRVPVKARQTLIIEAASEYCNIEGVKRRKAMLLINAFDAEGNPVDKPCGKMALSSHFQAYFKYLPCTQSQIQELHRFSVPEGVSEIRVGVCSFNQNDDEQVMLHELRVKSKRDESHPIQFVLPSAQAAEISILGWPDYPPNGKPYVIGIMDEFTAGCLELDVNLIQPRPDNWYALAEKYRPELFFIESAWKGNYGSWQYRVADYANKPGQEIAHICQYARQKGIPTLFWNKEDPVHHQKFMCSAKLVDHIFTTDANMKDSYQAETGNPNVHALPFAAQPALHKPAPLSGRKPRACFAGSWYGNRHAERCEAMRWLLQAANRYGLDIYDRNHDTGIFLFPEEFQAGIKGSLPYKELCAEYSRYRVFLNVNSVTDSPTMFSRRVFELMACGTPVVSTYAKGIKNLFESDAVWLVHSQEEADEALHTLMTDDAEWRRRSLAGIREVFAKHTYAHRLNDIFDRLGIEIRLPTNPAIGLVAETHSQAELQSLNQFAHEQSYRGFQLGIVCTPGVAQLAGSLSEKIILLQPGEKASWLAAEHADSPLAGWLSPKHHYGEHYLRDLVNSRLYQPEAEGWAKALDWDRFDYTGEACLGGALWRTAYFLKKHVKAHPEDRITDQSLFLADSDEFHDVGAPQHVVWG